MTMPHQALLTDPADTTIARGKSISILRRITDPGIALAMWDRQMSQALRRWLDALPPDPPPHGRLPHGRVLVATDDVHVALAAILARSGTPDTPEARLLVCDAAMLARRFATIAGGDEVDIRLETIRHDACWKFHVDDVRLRLLTTYRGPGTQIASPANAAEALARQRDYPGPLDEIPPRAVALFKGARGGAGVVHRSPPILGSGVVRLVLCVNLPSAASPPRWTP